MRYALYILLIAGLAALLYGWWDTNHFDVRRVQIELDRLPPAFDGFTILQVSDLHNRAYGRDGLGLERAIGGLPFDLVAIPGDLLDRHLPRRRDHVRAFLREVTARAPTYFTEGNHEWEIGGWEAIRSELEALGVMVLDEEKATLRRGSDQIDLYGIREETPAERIGELISPSRFSLLLAHHPERIGDYARAGADLVLSGHAHGGHVRLLGHGLYSPDQGVLPRYTSGIYIQGRTKVYVSRGAGNHSFLPPRIFNRPEIDLITLKTPSR